MGSAPAFSVIGISSTVAGGGDTENARYNTSAKYRGRDGPLRLSALYQFGGFDQGNGSNGAIRRRSKAMWGPGVDIVGQRVKDAVSLSNFGQYPLPAGVPLNGLKATLSNKASGLLARYTSSEGDLFSGWEYILFANPSDAYPNGSPRSATIPSRPAS